MCSTTTTWIDGNGEKHSETHDDDKCKYDPKTYDYLGKNRGWICPVCGRGNSPWTATCDCIDHGWIHQYPWIPPIIPEYPQVTLGHLYEQNN